MKTRFPLLRWFTSAQGLTGLLLVLTTACWFGYDFSQIYGNPPAPTYPPDFGKARWIAPTTSHGIGYFRKNLYIPETVRHAWLMVAAPNDFVVFVDNQKIHGATDLARARGVTGHQIPGLPTALLDLTPYLKTGTNTIAIYVISSSYQNPPCIRASGCVEYAMREEHFDSDVSWRASDYPGVLNNLIPWTDPSLDDTHWPLAQAIDYDDHGLVQPLSLPPELFQEPLQAHWICSFSKDPQVGMFSPAIDIPYGATDCWMQIASIGTQQIIINGHPIANSQEQLLIQRPNPQATFYWIQPWIKSGHNQFTVRLSDPSQTPLLLAQISYRNSAGKFVNLISDRHWTVQTVAGETHPALELMAATDAGTALALPPRDNAPGDYITSERNLRFVWNTLTSILIAFVLLIIHWLITEQILRRGILDAPKALALDASLHLPALVALLVLNLLSDDAHAGFSWASQPGPLWIIFILWFLLRWIVVTLEYPAQPPTEAEPAGICSWIQGPGFASVLFLITLISFALRAWGLNLFSLNQDEVFIRYCAQGIWERGFPSTNYAGSIQRLTTYEFLTYPIALSAVFFGWSDWAVRIPALLFSTFTTWNLGRMGRDLFSSKVGLLAASCYTLVPWDVFYARHCIHPAQAQFFALLCFWSFYKAIRTAGIVEVRAYYLACLYFILTYLTWEGSGLCLIALFIMLLVMQAGRWEWLRQFQVYLGLFFVLFTIFIQLCSRSFKVPSYLKIGYGLSGLTPQLTFLDQTDTPGYYIHGILREQCHWLLVVSLLTGAFFIGRSKPLRYVILLFGALLFLYSNLLPVYTARYFYFYQDLLILGACASLCYISDLVGVMLSDHAVILARRLVFLSGTVVIILVLLVSSTWCFQLIDTSTDNSEEGLTTRYGGYWQDAEPACRYVAQHWRPGDGVTGYYNYSYYHFTGHWVDFTLNENLAETSIFDLNRTPYGAYESSYIRLPSLQNDRDCVKAFSRFKRLWFIGSIQSTPHSDFLGGMNSYIISRSRIVYSGYQVKVYLADGMATRAGETLTDLGLPASPSLSSINDDPTQN